MLTTLLFIFLCLLAGIFVLAPLLLSPRRTDGREAEQKLCRAEKSEIIRTIRELDFDFATGKLAESDYRAARESAEERGIELLRRLDELCLPRDPADLESQIAGMRRTILEEAGRV